MTERSRQVEADLAAWKEESEPKSQAKLQREATRLSQEIRLHSPVLARPKRSRTIVSGNVVGFIDEEAFLVAIDGQSNPRPATSSDVEMLARRPVIQNGRRLCLFRPRPATEKTFVVALVVEAVSVQCESVESIDEDLRAQCEDVRERLLADDGEAHVMTDLLLSKGLLAPTGLIADWTLGDLFPMAYAFRMSEECDWDFHDCVEDLESYLAPD